LDNLQRHADVSEKLALLMTFHLLRPSVRRRFRSSNTSTT
jgi:hypothetical protein